MILVAFYSKLATGLCNCCLLPIVYLFIYLFIYLLFELGRIFAHTKSLNKRPSGIQNRKLNCYQAIKSCR